MAPGLPERIRDRAAERPGSLALLSPDGQAISFERFERAVAAFSHRLMAEGFRPGDVASVRVDNPAVQFCLWVAMLRIGTVPAIGCTPEKMARAGVRCDRAVILPDQSPDPATGHVFAQDWFEPRGEAPPIAADPGIVLTSSGSTGLQKYMMYGPGVFAARNVAMNAAAGAPTGPMLATIPLTNLAGFRYAMRAMAEGFGVVLPQGSNAATLRAAQEHGVTDLTAAPPALADLAAAVEADPSIAVPFARIETAGSSVSPSLLERVERALNCPVTVMYGCSEVGTISVAPPRGSDYEPGLVGSPMKGYEVEIRGPQGETLSVGESGRIFVRAPRTVRIGPYLNAEGPFDPDGWLGTGDMGRIRPDGQLVHEGRANDLINVGGTAYLPQVFEAVALGHPGVLQAAACGLPAAEGYDHVGIAVTAGEPLDLDALAAVLRAAFPSVLGYRVVQVEALPLLDAGKIDRRGLARQLVR